MYTLATVFVKFSCSTAFKSHGILSHFNFNHIRGKFTCTDFWNLVPISKFIRHLDFFFFFFLLYCTFLLFNFQGFFIINLWILLCYSEYEQFLCYMYGKYLIPPDALPFQCHSCYFDKFIILSLVVSVLYLI